MTLYFVDNISKEEIYSSHIVSSVLRNNIFLTKDEAFAEAWDMGKYSDCAVFSIDMSTKEISLVEQA